MSTAKKNKTKTSPKKQSEKQSEFTKIFSGSLRESDRQSVGEQLLGQIISHHEKLSAKHKTGQIHIEVCNPTEVSHGWFGLHTVINLVSDDMVFLIDSVTAYISEKSYLIEQIFHPHIYSRKGKAGKIEYVEKRQAVEEHLQAQTHMYIQLNRRLTETQMIELDVELRKIVSDVRLSTRDWRQMKTHLHQTKEDLEPLRNQDPLFFGECKQFLQYVHDDNFTLLGCRDYRVTGKGKEKKLKIVEGSGLGLFSADRLKEFLSDVDYNQFLMNLDARKNFPQLFVTKLVKKSPVHRRVPVDVIVVRQFNDKEELTGETHYIGLFTSVTYSRGIATVPYLWYKVDHVLKRAGFESGEHSERALRHILEKYPRDELFQISEDKLYTACMDILRLQERPRISLFVRPDPFGRTMSCLVYIPRDRYDTRIRIRFSMILEEEMNAEFIGFQSAVDDSPLVRTSFTLTCAPDMKHDYNLARIEKRLQQEGQNWAERLNDMLVERLENEDEAADLAYKYANAFPVGYQEAHQTRQAVHDIVRIENVLQSGDADADLFKPYDSGTDRVSLKIYSPKDPVSLSDILPILENMGLRVEAEYPYQIWPMGAEHAIWIQDFHARIDGMASNKVDKASVQAVRENFKECLKGIWNKNIENDSLNRLVLLADMKWRDVKILRTYVRYMRQSRIPFSLPYMEQAATDYPQIAKLLIDYFYAKFSTAKEKKPANLADTIAAKIEQELQNVSSLDQDRVLRALLATMKATLRTNFFQMDQSGMLKSWVSVKLDSAQVPNIPDPRPFREIFVYSPRIEGVHLRGGKIARGGLRWSDRHEDFRVEVLGLMKAQQVKNAVIVPMGAKGGFVVKMPPKSGGREAYQAEGIACYQTFIRGLLDITDNRLGQKIIPPKDVVRLDGDDPYLVVAADKGTATFSDIANAISAEYGFWLGDAFASGGSVGYDHKKMGITARGAWESVKRHFRELNHDTQTQEFDCVGIGDMGGDVFGNGLLRSKKIRMVGAFNHMHIFCDPAPDTEETFKERDRLFKAVKGWGDYDTAKLSKGGRIYLRSEKSLKLTPEIQKRFDLEKDTVSPNELIQAMLRARTDLLFFGGIGTYIKSTNETNADAGDRSNDALRVNAADIRAKVIGEGANLAVTQRGRIEFAKKGGRLNTDFIDNSAGVDTSDHEVNIKILLSEVVRDPKEKLTQPTRNKLLADMTGDIAELVLKDNYQQTQALSLLEMTSADLLTEHAEFMRSLERAGLLNRKVEFLPNDEELEERMRIHKGLTRPELSLLVCYGKLTYTNALLSSKLPDDPDMLDWVVSYFPEILQKKYKKQIESHQLRREIIAMAVSNSVVNRLGPTFIRKVMDRTGADVATVTYAYLIVRDAFGLRNLWAELEAQDNKVPASVQLRAMLKTVKLAERETYWILTKLGRELHRGKDSEFFSKGLLDLKKNITAILPKDVRANYDMRVDEWVSNGLPEKLAKEVAMLPLLGSAFDILQIAHARKIEIRKVAQVYFSLGSLFRFEKLRTKVLALDGDNPHMALAAAGMVDSLNTIQSDMTAHVIHDLPAKELGLDSAENWVERYCPRARFVLETIADMEKSGSADMATLVVIDQQLRTLR
ncbi:MAG TPA: NAD-glutamate dehydrogenase [Alphaproteobacteria bacterium]|nr:NAD-glutamate dehydrogenase [Alphaproteobacteria bacterium]HNS43600.1 NAD-glutamate dehydrogenase [Alphaproteobacteria bacterium]